MLLTILINSILNFYNLIFIYFIIYKDLKPISFLLYIINQIYLILKLKISKLESLTAQLKKIIILIIIIIFIIIIYNYIKNNLILNYNILYFIIEIITFPFKFIFKIFNFFNIFKFNPFNFNFFDWFKTKQKDDNKKNNTKNNNCNKNTRNNIIFRIRSGNIKINKIIKNYKQKIMFNSLKKKYKKIKIQKQNDLNIYLKTFELNFIEINNLKEKLNKNNDIINEFKIELRNKLIIIQNLQQNSNISNNNINNIDFIKQLKQKIDYSELIINELKLKIKNLEINSYKKDQIYTKLTKETEENNIKFLNQIANLESYAKLLEQQYEQSNKEIDELLIELGYN